MSVSHILLGTETPLACEFKTIKLDSGAVAGNVLTSDSSGNATWQTSGGGSTGSWTPQLLFNGSNTGITYSTPPTGTYSVSGNMVFITGQLQMSNVSGFAGDAIPTISGLPVSVGTLSTQSTLTCSWGSYNLDTNAVYVSAHPTPGTSLVTPTQGYSTASPEISLYQMFWTNTSVLYFSGFYFTT
jgi:hypothetical protein